MILNIYTTLQRWFMYFVNFTTRELLDCILFFFFFELKFLQTECNVNDSTQSCDVFCNQLMTLHYDNYSICIAK